MTDTNEPLWLYKEPTIEEQEARKKEIQEYEARKIRHIIDYHSVDIDELKKQYVVGLHTQPPEGWGKEGNGRARESDVLKQYIQYLQDQGYSNTYAMMISCACGCTIIENQ